MKVDGHCHCGRIRFEAVVDPATVTVCHCTDCQILTGSAFRANIQTRAEDFKITGPEPRSYIKTAESGNKRRHAFCGDCGTPLYATSVETPQRYSLRVGTISQRAQLAPPMTQIWTRSRLDWVNELENVPGVDKG